MHTRFALVLLSLSFVAVARAEDPEAPLSPQATLEQMTLPPGFQATLFAGEPDVVQPIALTFDDRGRMWVVECLSYPDWNQEPQTAGHDRVVIFEDRDGDGRFDSRKVFWDEGSNLSGVEVGFRRRLALLDAQLDFRARRRRRRLAGRRTSDRAGRLGS